MMNQIYLVGGIVGWIKKLYNFLVDVVSAIISLIETLLKAIAWIPSLISQLFQSIAFLPSFLLVFASLAIILLVVNYIAGRK